MNITDALSKNLGIAGDSTTDTKQSRKTSSAPAPAAGEQGSVTLSPLSAQLQSLEANVALDNVFDADKVEAIKLAISNGEFQIDAGKIADGLIDTVQALLKPQK